MVKNIIANIFGRFWSILSNFLFIPLYIHFLGFENFSIISFTLILTGIMAILDAGMTATLSREFARGDISISSLKNIFSTLEKLYLGIIALILILIMVFAEVIVANWINVETKADLAFIIRVVGFDISFQMLLKFYMGGLLGAGKQVKANIYQIFWGILRNAVVVLLIYYNPTLNTFFLWQAFSTIIFAIIFRVTLTKTVFSNSFLFNGVFDKSRLKEVGNFAIGMFLISIVSAISTQLDKLVISKLLPVSELGYYTIAVSIAMGLVVIINPIATASLPKFTSLFSTEKTFEANQLFTKINIYTSLIVVSMMSMLIVYSKELIWIWTGDSNIAKNSSLILSTITFAYGSLAIALLPNNICIANAFTKFNNYLGLCSIFITIPGYLILVKHYGAVGAAVVFSIVQMLITIAFMVLVNKKYLKISNFLILEIKSIFLPLIFAILIFKLSQFFLNQLSSNRFIYLLIIGFILLFVTLLNFLIFVPKEHKETIFSVIKAKLNYAR